MGELDIAYTLAGPDSGETVLLLHGWPDDASTWDAVAAALNAGGWRTLTPALRGFGETRFTDGGAPRTANSAMLAMDAIGLVDALGIDRFAVVGHDWGANIAEALAVGWPERVTRLAMLSSPPRLGGLPTPSFEHAQREWYHWFMATERGAQAVGEDRRGFAHLHWTNWSPPGWFEDATFERVAEAWDNPDWLAVTLHSYRSRWNVAAPDARSVWLETEVRTTRTLSLPAMYVQGAEDGVNPPETTRGVPEKFSGPFEYVTLPGVGHFPQREAPDALLARLIPFLEAA
ncbi:alpha/beta hydrolase [Sphingomonas metalli]|uniref:Alpha/beta hydrolase n=1 Tax=Sphingomonas metalli TaxID=1779358 RepID=A0A916T483_9SPHN|nr:alpha/beta hydrolase [Sphingomonas metalli]GGB31458.1 alpha/beta hydrolase [Sphingomonas metalli]